MSDAIWPTDTKFLLGPDEGVSWVRLDFALACISALEAELAALKARRCEGCEHWEPDEHTYGWCETVLDEDNPIATRPDFACNRWSARIQGGSE